MGQLGNTQQSIIDNLKKFTEYYQSQEGSLEDPSVAPGSADEAFKDVNTTELKDAIQTTILGSASTAGASLLACYRDLDSMKAELALRHRSRADYWAAAKNETKMVGQKWQDNMQMRLYNVTGQRQEA